LPFAASSVRSRPKLSSAGVLLFAVLRRGTRATFRRRLLFFFLFLRVGAEEVEHLLAHVLELHAEVDQHLRGDALVLLDQAEQQVLRPDVVVPRFDGSSIESSSTFLARGVKGSWPIVTI
jgi:hypothetical protein